MKSLNRKGSDFGSFFLIAGLVIFTLLLVSRFYLILPFATAGPAVILTSSCRVALEKRADVTIWVSDNRPDNPEWYDYIPFGLAGRGIIRSSVDKTVGETIDTVSGPTKALLKEACLMANWECTGSADEVAVCLYKRATDTYYNLLGGLDEVSGIDDATYFDFDLFEVRARVNDGPGRLWLFGKCEKYVEYTDNEDYNCSTRPNPLQQEKEICFNDILTDRGERCEIMFTEINSYTIGLSMIEECQRRGVFSSGCKCFAIPDLGYSASNGLPLDKEAIYDGVFKSLDQLTNIYEDEDIEDIADYVGCGWDSPYTLGGEVTIPLTKKENDDANEVKIDRDRIKFNTLHSEGLGLEDDKTFYFRLNNDHEVVISDTRSN